jgi:hypothetical protein
VRGPAREVNGTFYGLHPDDPLDWALVVSHGGASSGAVPWINAGVFSSSASKLHRHS